jgi:hypothetical protein
VRVEGFMEEKRLKSYLKVKVRKVMVGGNRSSEGAKPM